MSISRHQARQKLENTFAKKFSTKPRTFTDEFYSDHIFSKRRNKTISKMIQGMNATPFNFQVRFYDCSAEEKKELYDSIHHILTNYIAAQISTKKFLVVVETDQGVKKLR
jgi:hypothetical protein